MIIRDPETWKELELPELIREHETIERGLRIASNVNLPNVFALRYALMELRSLINSKELQFVEVVV